MNLTVY